MRKVTTVRGYGHFVGGQMRIIAFITHSADIRQILAHMRLNFLSVFMDGTAGRAAGLPLAQPSQC